MRLYRVIFLAGFLAILGAGIAERGLAARDRARWTEAQAIPTVSLAKLTTDQGSAALTLPGTIEPINKAAIFARVPGYLKEWRADIGAHVAAGQLLASIDTPDLDQQLAQAEADLDTAQANEKLAAVTAERWHGLAGSQAVAQQAVDEKEGDAAAKRALAAAAQANLARLRAMQGFKRITAPFDGVVTARKTDIGALISAGSAGQELFEVSDLRRIRLYVQVPQALSAGLRPGIEASFTLPQYPGRIFAAAVSAMSGALDAKSRSMLVELQAANDDGALPAGAYCQVKLPLPPHAGSLQIPATALLSSDRGAEVALLSEGGKVAFRSVQLGRDFGDRLEVLSGLTESDRVIDNPPETLQQGDAVLWQKSAADARP